MFWRDNEAQQTVAMCLLSQGLSETTDVDRRPLLLCWALSSASPTSRPVLLGPLGCQRDKSELATCLSFTFVNILTFAPKALLPPVSLLTSQAKTSSRPLWLLSLCLPLNCIQGHQLLLPSTLPVLQAGAMASPSIYPLPPPSLAPTAS